VVDGKVSAPRRNVSHQTSPEPPEQRADATMPEHLPSTVLCVAVHWLFPCRCACVCACVGVWAFDVPRVSVTVSATLVGCTHCSSAGRQQPQQQHGPLQRTEGGVETRAASIRSKRERKRREGEEEEQQEEEGGRGPRRQQHTHPQRPATRPAAASTSPGPQAHTETRWVSPPTPPPLQYPASCRVRWVSGCSIAELGGWVGGGASCRREDWMEA
jgi:hypothetical protein